MVRVVVPVADRRGAAAHDAAARCRPRTGPPVPQFITSGAWRQCAPEGGVIVPVPLPTPRQAGRDALAGRGQRRLRHPGGLLHRPVRAGGQVLARHLPAADLAAARAASPQTGRGPRRRRTRSASRPAATSSTGAPPVSRWPTCRTSRRCAPRWSSCSAPAGPIADTWTWTVGRLARRLGSGGQPVGVTSVNASRGWCSSPSDTTSRLRNSASVQSTTTRTLRLSLGIAAHVVGAVHEPREQPLSLIP